MQSYTYQEVYEKTLEYFNGDDLAANVFASKYALNDGNGNYFELTPADMHRRLAKEFARIEAKYPNAMSEEEIFELLDRFQYVVPQGSPMSAIGNDFQLQTAGNCFVKGTKVLTINDGVKNIENVVVGDEVPTHNGNIKPVTQIHRNKLANRQLFDIKCFRTPNFSVTDNHKFWSISEEQLQCGEKPGWNSIEYLRKGDWIAIPNVNTNDNQKYIDIYDDIYSKLEIKEDSIWYEYNVENKTFGLTTCWLGKKRKNIPINRHWKIDNNFAFFLGLWYGDSCVFSQSKHETRLRGITFTFGKHERSLISFVAEYGSELFGLKADVNWHNADIDGSVQIVFKSAAVAYAFQELFGRGCRGKKLPSFIYNWSRNKVEKLIAGLVSSDGTVTDKGDVRVVLTNKELIQSFYHLARMNSFPLGISCAEKTARLDFPKHTSFLQHVIKQYDDDRIKLAIQKDESAFHVKEIDNTLFVKIENKTRSAVKDTVVYTFGVEEDHSYSIEGLVCQNCYVIEPPWDSYGGIMKADQELAQLMKKKSWCWFGT